MPATRRISTAAGPLDAVVTVPGSKSIANRALVCAALADGVSVLRRVPDGDDTAALVACLGALGVSIERGAVTPAGASAVVTGTGGRLPSGAHQLDARLAGTTSRFVTALAALADGPVTVTGDAPLRRRPMGPLHDALRQLGATVATPDGAGTLPVTVSGPLRRGGSLTLAGGVSSQYLTALMLVAPLLDGGLELALSTPLVSAPYVRLTAAVMASFGVGGVVVDTGRIVVPPGRYRATTLSVEPDASSASYPLAMAALAGGRVVVPGLTRDSAQGDVAIVALLEAMGCRRTAGRDVGIERFLDRPLVGLDADLGATSDLVPTVAAVAAAATTPSRLTGIGFIRAKESDRLGDVATELRKLGARVDVEPDGLRIEPAALHGATLATHHDHRLAMAFGVLGTVVPGVRVEDPDVVTKSWPAYWAAREEALATSRAGAARRVVAAFDVDGTLTQRDCVVPFLRLVAGTPRLAAGLGRRPWAFLRAAARRDRDELKALATSAVFAGRPLADVEALARDYARRIELTNLRDDTLARLRWHQAAGHETVLVSASYGVYVRPLAAGLGVDAVVATELAVDGAGRCTGELVGGNCRGPEKRRRFDVWLAGAHGPRAGVEVWAYGDSAGDRPLLAGADHPVWAVDPLTPAPAGPEAEGSPP